MLMIFFFGLIMTMTHIYTKLMYNDNSLGVDLGSRRKIDYDSVYTNWSRFIITIPEFGIWNNILVKSDLVCVIFRSNETYKRQYEQQSDTCLSSPYITQLEYLGHCIHLQKITY